MNAKVFFSNVYAVLRLFELFRVISILSTRDE